MHKYYARRPWNVFSEIILNYSSPGDIVLDPFCGGGTTVFESLKLRRKAVGVDVNSLATYITQMECRSADTESLRMAFSQVLDQTRLKCRFQADPEKSYAVEVCAEPESGPWVKIAEAPATAAPQLIELILPKAGTGAFYRLVGSELP